jgi:hypothetical protein
MAPAFFLTKEVTMKTKLEREGSKEDCMKCGAPATDWVSTRTFTVERPAGRYLCWLCPKCFAAEQVAWEAWADRESDPGLN